MSDMWSQSDIDNISDLIQGRDADRRNRPMPGDMICPRCGTVINPNPQFRAGRPGRCCAESLNLPQYDGMTERGYD